MVDLHNLIYMARDFWPVLTGRDYFHQPQRLGGYFQDRRCYYNDFTGKTVWKGKYLEGVPALYIPAWEKHITFPIMVLQYGLGSVDKFFIEGDKSYLDNIANVTLWLLRNLNSEDYLDNHFPVLDTGYQYFSSNSAMAQGQALSFLIRVKEHGLFNEQLAEELNIRITSIFSNMIRPLEKQGTALKKDSDVYFCEVCRTDDYVVLNGWIYAIFGLLDYYLCYKDSLAREHLEATLMTLKRELPAYMLPTGWSYYDNKGRVCSPFYQALHIYLFEALHRLKKEYEFDSICMRLRAAYTFGNRMRFTLAKIREKIADSQAYTSHLN